ncbi:MAG: phosphoribosyltransferase [Bacilli bacterium]|nr:phosphoribosyltransferase [Bacilli bacterium]
MKYKYTEKDLDLISWKRIDEFIDKIYSDVKNYITENNLKIKYIAPILRGGGVPAVKLSHMFNIIDMLPIQLKHNSETHDIDLKVGLDYKKNTQVAEDECILLVEGNHVTGTTSNIAVKLLREKFGENVKIIYVSLTRDYSYRNNVDNVCYTTWGLITNETKQISEEECKKLGINYHLVSVYPWENIKEELFELNNE